MVENQTQLSVFISEKAQVDSLSLNYLKEAKTFFDSIFGMDFSMAVLYVSNDEWNQYAYHPSLGTPQAWTGNIFLGSKKIHCGTTDRAATEKLAASAIDQIANSFW